MQATGHALDSLGSTTNSAARTVNDGGATGIRSVRTSFWGTRVNWGNSIDESVQGPDLTYADFLGAPTGPVTLGTTLTILAAGRIVAIRIYKHPSAAGTMTFGMWNSTGTLMATAVTTWSADNGGWVEIPIGPVSIIAGNQYHWGFLYPNANTNYAVSPWVMNNGQDTCVYPFLMTNFTETGGGVRAGGNWRRAGSSLTLGNTAADRIASNYYIDPVIEFDLDTPGYNGGTAYYDQFINGAPTHGFPIAVFFADPENLAAYMAIGVNTLIAGQATPGYIDAVISSDMDWYPVIEGGNMSAPIAVQEDAALAACVRGYTLTDEPDLITPFNPPSTLRAWRNACRHIDSTRPIFLNLSRYVLINQGFTWQPVGVSAQAVNEEWREYMTLCDITSLDAYAIEYTDSFNFRGTDPRRYGIWIYPLIIKRMREQITDQRIPVWGVVETTSNWAGSPTPTQVQRAVWASLIPGATGIMYFDHRFTSPQVSQDFAAMLNDAPMSAAISALNTQIQSLSGPLYAPDAGLIESYTSSGSMAAAAGGYPAGARIPMHYTSRLSGGSTYIFAQSIRPGTTTATFTMPSMASTTLTVIGESRTVSVNSSGVFSDTFTGNYAYHLYSTTADPVFTTPANTVAPVVSDDGTPTTGEVVTVSSGTWTGAPSPTLTYQWQRSTNGGTSYSSISGATSSSYTLAVSDETYRVRCQVTGTNSQGSASATSNYIVPVALDTTIFADTFNRSDGAAANGWTVTSGGAVNIVSNQLAITGYAGYGHAMQSALPKEVSVRATFATAGAVGFQGIFLGRHATTGLGVKLFNTGSNWVIGDAGGPFDSNTTLSGIPSSPFTTLRLDYDGTYLSAYINGVLVLSPSAPGPLNITFDADTGDNFIVGICGEAGHTNIDQFEVWSL